MMLAVLFWCSPDSVLQIDLPSGKLQLSQKDSEKLEYLFRDLIVYGDAGYTVLGNKPVSFITFFKPEFRWDWTFLWHAFMPSNIKKYHAWKTWKKYQHLFNQGNICMWSEQDPCCDYAELIVVLNKNEFKKVLHENADDFISMKEMDPQSVFDRSYQLHPNLLGILLGYGKQNAWCFHTNQRSILKSVFAEEIKKQFQNKRVCLNFLFGWPKVDMAEILLFPNFMANIETDETKSIKSEYLKTRCRILEHYADKNFLQATLQLFLKT